LKQLSTPFEFQRKKAGNAVFHTIQNTAAADLPPQRQYPATSVAVRRQNIAACIGQLFIKEPT